jgi:predicted metal-dependent phosphoesterase TrpH
MFKAFKTDLHIHTCLSPCGDLLMSPKRIVARALEQKIDIIAITDHNSAENTSAAMKAATGSVIVVFPGMEVCTKEEIHILAIFENLASVLEFQELVYLHLQGENNPGVFGDQIIANENDEVEGYQNKFLLGTTDLSLEEIVTEIHRLNGLAIASHIDRESYSILGQLGFIPETVHFEALELSSNIDNDSAKKRFNMYAGYTFIRNSDAHFVDDIGKNTSTFFMAYPSFSEMRNALHAEDGRSVRM